MPSTPSPKLPAPLDAIGGFLAARALGARRRLAALVAASFVALAAGSLLLHGAGARAEFEQGEREAEAAAADARRAMALWTPERGYAALAEREVWSDSSWGATRRVEALAQGSDSGSGSGSGSGVSVDYVFARQGQCRGLLAGGAPFFDTILVDGRPARNAAGSADPSACTAVGQNAVRFAKLDRRSDASALSAGAMDQRLGGAAPRRAQPAPSSDTVLSPPPPGR